MAPRIELRNLLLRFPPAPPLLQEVDLSIARGERLAILGPSGAGKSSLLRLLCGLQRPTAGTLRWWGQPFPAPPDPEQSVALVHQHPVLFPHLDVRANLAIGWRLRYNVFARRWWGESEPSPLRPRLDQVAELLELGPLLQRWPATLSGGEKQRVALGRALVSRPAVFLLDEPLAYLDTALADRILGRLVPLLAEWQATVVWVTHRREEADRIAHRVLLLRDGRIQQSAPPGAP